MRRALLVSLVTAVLVVGLLRYKTSSAPQSLRIAVGASPPAASASPTPGPDTEAPPPTTVAPPAPTAAAPPATAAHTVSGPVETNQFGPVQVVLTLQGSKITDVQTPELPTDRARSAYISSVAGPLLRREALAAQSAQIDTISGATYTSYSFAQSLQAALTKAGV
ncbi:MAG TPA: FMN-binding protein [Actinomycetota bacterium]|nr:FMN-binding protein [Actinomycetota bacterium]